MAHLGGSNFDTEVVGESHYIQTLAACFKVGRRSNNDKRSYITVRLVLENQNKYDSNAVAVVSELGTIGYLSRSDAVDYRKSYGEQKTHTTDAVIVTRDGTKFGVWLDVDLYNHDDCDEQSDSVLLDTANKSIAVTATPKSKPVIIIDKPKLNRTKEPPPKPWREMSTVEKVLEILVYLFLLGVLYVVYRIVTWFFGLIF